MSKKGDAKEIKKWFDSLEKDEDFADNLDEGGKIRIYCSECKRDLTWEDYCKEKCPYCK